MSPFERPIPGGLEAHEARVDGLRLRLALAPELPGGRSLLLLTGRTEFLEKYEDVFVALRDRGFRVATLEWRGQGASDRLITDRRRGHARDFGDFQRDLASLEALAAAHLPQPWYALAHSMGCIVLLEALAAAPDRVAKAALCAPFLGIAAAPPLKRLAPWLSRAACHLGFATRYVPGHGDAPAAGDDPHDNVLTSDADRFRLYRQRCRRHDDLMLGGVTWGWLAAALQAVGRLERPDVLERTTTPLLLLEAGNERVVDRGALARAAARLPDAQIVRLDGAEHELLMEADPIRDRVFNAIDDFLR